MRTNYSFSIALLFFCFLSLAQKAEKSNVDFQNDPAYLFIKNSTLLLENSKKSNDKDVFNLQNNVDKGILIQQIGNFDEVNIKLKSKEINVSILQNGNNNNLNLYNNANRIQQNIIQEGARNKILDYTIFTNYTINTEFIQQGDNQSIQNFGTNSISRNMKIIQSGNGASVVIVNLK